MSVTQTIGTIELTIDGKSVLVPSGSTVLDAARSLGIDIPVLCHAQEQTPIGVCRVCTVQVKGARVFAAACVRTAEPGMEVETASEPVLRARRTLYEMLLADHPTPCLRQQTTQDCELETQAARAGVVTPRFAPHHSDRVADDSCRSSTSSATRASCATAASAPAPRSSTTLSSDARARAPTPPSPSISMSRWGSRPAWDAASAWCRVRPAR